MSSSFFTVSDGTKIFYKDWGKGQPVLFSHGWPLTADAWDGQMLAFLNEGYRVIAHDRRGHGRSSQTFDGNNMDQYADDLAELIDHLDLQNLILVGHSTGGGEVARYIGRHGSTRVAKAVLVGAVPPLMLKTAQNPEGLPIEVFDDIRKGVTDNRSQFFIDLSKKFYGFNRMMHKTVDGTCDSFWLQGMMGGIKAEYDCIEQFSETDFTEDLKRMDIPTLLIHGSDDQIVPIIASSIEAVKFIPNAELKVYEGAPHGLPQTHAEKFNADLLEFFDAETEITAGRNKGRLSDQISSQHH
ncbi:alpha/beta fold hydrolase [Bdellovibrio sp. KM01]|uniref:alpha/beta fold hydrolase n=1 Tax=Bdellovibrio sp. KM01 TaxID=2748865 RepID=UPI0015E9C3E2|nr:alpha/beta hydrolase [Bdellovibrio sp. KM01]QLY24550.1 alpha/beta hydrolase [Bdellovibrio sp. KM01]